MSRTSTARRPVASTTACLLAVALLALLALAGAVPAGARPDRGPVALDPSPGAPAAVPGQVLVHLRAGTSAQSVDDLAASLGASQVTPVSAASLLPGGERIVLLTVPDGSPVKLAASAAQDPDVISASPNYVRSTTGSVYPDDPRFAEQWGLENTGQGGGTPGADISAPEAWGWTTGSSGTVVADIDTGVDYTHEDLAANMWHNPGEIPNNKIDDDGNGYVDDIYGIDAANKDSDPYDDHGHGTHTSGTVAAVGDNGIGVTGVSWNTQIMALKFLSASGSGSDADAITCINYVVHEKLDHGVNVVAINASWGGGGFDQLLKDAIDTAGDAGIVFCAAAGNNYGNDNDVNPFYPAAYTSSNLIAVASTDSSDGLSDFSNFGLTSVDLGAPGSGILSTLPGDAYASWSGTSMATPHVSGAVALAAAAFPSDTLSERVARILASTDPLPALAGKCVTGGRLDLLKVVTEPVTYTLTPSAGLGGTITPSTPQLVPAGGSKLFTIAANSGYHVKNVLVDGASVGAVGTYEFKDVTEDHTIAASFERNPAVSITAPATGPWEIGRKKTVTWTLSTAPTVGSFRVWATPKAGGTTRAVSTTVVPVTGGTGPYDLECTWTLPAGDWYLSVFYYDAAGAFKAQNSVKPVISAFLGLSITASAGSGGTISPSGVTPLDPGGSQVYTITPLSGYHVKDVLVDGVSVGAVTGYTFSNVTVSHTIAASFERNPAITVTNPATGLWALGGKRVVSWTLSPTVKVGSFRVWATPAAGGTTRAVSTTVVPVVANQTAYSLECTWNLPAGDWKLSVYYYDGAGAFKAQNSVKPVITAAVAFTITATSTSSGSISPVGVVTLLPGGSQVFTIAPSAGYHAVDVLVDGVSQGPVTSYTFTGIAADHTIAASFERNPAITVTAPVSGVTWLKGEKKTVSWSVSPTVTVGSFRVWATPKGGTTMAVSTTVVPAQAGKATYSLECTWTLGSGQWALSVYYYDAAGVMRAQNSVQILVNVP